MPRAARHHTIDRPTAPGRLHARPVPGAHAPPRERPGLQPLGIGYRRDGLRYVPPSYHPDHPAPMVLMLHGAGGDADNAVAPFLRFADAYGLILLAPDSRGNTWDVILDEYGHDVEFIDHALAQTFERYAVDPARLAIEGFSDGASYALSLGIINGDLWTHIIAFSPGFIALTAERDHPRVFISHGTRDSVLRIDRCSQRLVPQLRDAGYDVRYEEFNGEHTVPAAIARDALDWFTSPEE
ncbi:MAG TPA: hypothetical protein VFJ96_01865 [Gemmatimonadaceae bacterium]|nr:hypothetical protein [Gemmatimonadaceae bacterium]